MLNKENYVPWLSHLLREVPAKETFHDQTEDEITKEELKQVEADDQAIQTILLGLPEDIYAANGNGNVVAARAKVVDCSKEEVGIQLQAEEFDLMAVAADLDEIEEVNANCILMANLQQASTSEAAKFVRDFKSFGKEADESLAKNKALELEIERLLRAVDTTKGKSTNTKFANQSAERKPSLQSLRNTFVVRQPDAFQSERPNFIKTWVPKKVDKMNDLSNPVTSKSIPTPKESKVVENDKVTAPGMSRIDSCTNSREDNPNKVLVMKS
nr:hypothetical protein [Tanacetum cinerariifolium]